MKIAIVGAGKVGYQLARYLSREKNDVLVIDNRADLISYVNDTLDAVGHVGSGIDPHFLEQIGLQDCEMIIAVTRSDERNMIACQIAYSMFDVDLRIARVRSPHLYHNDTIQLFSPDHIPVNLAISPEHDIAQVVLRRIDHPGAAEIIPIAHNDPYVHGGTAKALLIGVYCHEDCPVLYTPLRQLSILFPDLQITVLAIVRAGTSFMPTSDDEMLPKDIVYFSASTEHTERSLAVFGHTKKPGSKLTVLGGGLVGQSIIESLHKLPMIKRCRVIERDKANAQKLARRHPEITVIHGKATDLDLLEDLSLSDEDVVVSVTSSDETNIVAASMYKVYGAQTSLALVSNDRLASMIDNFSLDGVIDPRSITISTVLRYIRRGRIHRVNTFQDGFAECLEGEVMRGSPLAGVLIRDLDLPSGIKIAGILHKGQYVLPRPQQSIEVGDIVSILSMVDKVKQAQRLLSLKVETF